MGPDDLITHRSTLAAAATGCSHVMLKRQYGGGKLICAASKIECYSGGTHMHMSDEVFHLHL